MIEKLFEIYPAALDEAVLFDIGANIGQTVKETYPFVRRVVSFEPHPKTFEKLKHMVTKKGVSNVEILNLALSDRTGVGRITDKDVHQTNSICDNGSTSVQLRMLDELCIEADVIKIDVEGHEFNVIKGGKTTIRAAKLLAIETDERLVQKLIEEVKNLDFTHVETRKSTKNMRDVIFVKSGFANERQADRSTANQANAKTDSERHIDQLFDWGS